LCRSIQAQTYSDYEVLIGDDGSSDDTATVLAPFLQDRRFRVLAWKPNRGLNQGLAMLCAAMRGDYWSSPGADDALHPLFLEKRVALLEGNPQAFVAHGPPELVSESDKAREMGPINLSLPPRISPPRSLEILLQHNIINQPSAMVRSSVTKEVLPFLHWNWAYSPDWFLWILHAATGFDIMWDPRMLIRCRLHANSLSYEAQKDHLRRAERRLVPLIALRQAAHYSQWASGCWTHLGRRLYWQWLRQALALRSRKGLRSEWVQLAAQAYYGFKGKPVSFGMEVAKHAVGVLTTDLLCRRALKRQRFPISGLAHVDDPIFR
jgi:GT2 family glycosyltransferase